MLVERRRAARAGGRFVRVIQVWLRGPGDEWSAERHKPGQQEVNGRTTEEYRAIRKHHWSPTFLVTAMTGLRFVKMCRQTPLWASSKPTHHLIRDQTQRIKVNSRASMRRGKNQCQCRKIETC